MSYDAVMSCDVMMSSLPVPRAVVGERGAAGEAAARVDGLLRDGRRDARRHAEELQEEESSSRHSDGGEMAGRVPATPPMPRPLRRRGRGRRG